MKYLARHVQAGRNLDQHCEGQQGCLTAASLRPCLRLPAGPTSAEPRQRRTAEFTDHTAAMSQKKWYLIMVYIKLNVILNIGLQFMVTYSL